MVYNIALKQDFESQIWTNKCGGNGMVMDPYAHPQQMNVLEHLEYASGGCGNHSRWVLSLNHCTMVPDHSPTERMI
jgi:hypothetical protein